MINELGSIEVAIIRRGKPKFSECNLSQYHFVYYSGIETEPQEGEKQLNCYTAAYILAGMCLSISSSTAAYYLFLPAAIKSLACF
jgi:hypothetical protein